MGKYFSLRPIPNRKIFLLLAIPLVFNNLTCKKSKNNENTLAPKALRATQPFDDTDRYTDQEPKQAIEEPRKIVVKTIEAQKLATNELYTQDAAKNRCVDVGFILQNDMGPVSNANVTFKIDSKNEISGNLSSDMGVTDESGKATTSFCSGDKEGTVFIVGFFNELKANSSEITITKNPVFHFSYDYSERTIQDMGKDQKRPISLNLNSYGPNDCTNLYFRILQGNSPVADIEIKFKTQIDYPKGSKLAKKDDPLQTEIDSATGKKYAFYETESNTAGYFIVPICAGDSIGTIVVSGEFKEETVYKAQSPVISIAAGFANFPLIFDPTNTRTLRGYFDTNSNHIHPFTVKLGANKDGNPITDYSLTVIAETGKVLLENSGIPSEIDGAVRFTLQALHLGDYRPYQIVLFDSGNHMAQSRCNADAISTDPVQLPYPDSTFKYFDLAKNWRSTLVYAIRGQEFYNDANRNGKYEVGGDGFWDKNQNGIFDSNDELTYDANNNGRFDSNSEWFIDLPTPFVDVDEDGVFDSAKDILIGDEYHPPNSKRDSDTIIWKYEYIPLYLGTSPYAMQHGYIEKDYLGIPTNDALAQTYFTSLDKKGLRKGHVSKLFMEAPMDDDDFFIPGATAEERRQSGSIWRYLYAHGVCGNALPGEAKISVNFEDQYKTQYGERSLTAHFYRQAGDWILEPTMRLLKSGNGSSSATISSNAALHPSKVYGYPVEFQILLGTCLNECTGEVATPGVACDSMAKLVHLTSDTVTITQALSINAVRTCTCKAKATFISGDCQTHN